MSTPNKVPLRKLILPSTMLPPVVVDCSDAPRAPGPRPRGKLVSPPRHFLRVSIDCSPRPKVWMEITVSFTLGYDPATVESWTLKLIQAALDAAPELGLAYDKGRSRVVGEDTVIVLVPQHPAGAQERLSAVKEQLLKAATQPGTVPVKGIDVEICMAA